MVKNPANGASSHHQPNPWRAPSITLKTMVSSGNARKSNAMNHLALGSLSLLIHMEMSGNNQNAASRTLISAHDCFEGAFIFQFYM
nr:MAG TPA: hypothetical protein [Caudoviricetes sp.]